MESLSILSDEFDRQVKAAIAQAVKETLEAGVSIFYRDSDEKIDVMEQPDGRKLEIRFIPNGLGDQDYEVLRELGKSAA